MRHRLYLLMRSGIWPLAFLLLFTFPSFGQLNESDTAHFQLRAGATGAWQQGNVELLVLRARLELVSNSHQPLVFKTQNNSLYQGFSGRKADNDLNSRNYLYWKPANTVYPFTMAYVQTNFRRQIDFRWFAGAGATWQVVQKPRTNLKLSGSLVKESTAFSGNRYNETAYNGSSQINLWRGTLYLAGLHLLFNERLKLYYAAYWQPGLEHVPNNRAQLDAGMDFAVWKGLSFLVQYNMSYEQVVATSVKQDDRMLTFGLSYQLKK